MSTHTLVIDIHNWWQPGTGRGSGAHLDALANTDADGIPELPGRTVKGLLRDAVRRAEELGWIEEGLTESLFGKEADQDGNGSTPGALRIASARLSGDERRWLASQAGEAARKQLFAELASTAIDADTGSARAASLRAIQVVLPLKLEARIDRLPGHELPDAWDESIEKALPLIRAVGSGRSRGLGRATLSLKERP